MNDRPPNPLAWAVSAASRDAANALRPTFEPSAHAVVVDQVMTAFDAYLVTTEARSDLRELVAELIGEEPTHRSVEAAMVCVFAECPGLFEPAWPGTEFSAGEREFRLRHKPDGPPSERERRQAERVERDRQQIWAARVAATTRSNA